MTVGVVDYQAGNLRSVETALHHLGAEYLLSSDPDRLLRTDRLIFPGDGHAGAAMTVLNSTGLGEAIHAFFASGRPIFGICLGCQIVLEGSEETESPCLGIVPGRARLFPFAKARAGTASRKGARATSTAAAEPTADRQMARPNGPAAAHVEGGGSPALKVPHMGWNEVHPLRSDPLFEGIPDNASFYFVHSYYTEPDAEYRLCTTDYGISFASGLRRENLWAVQFHPEKSGEHGLRMVSNFLNIAP
ncbi:glutamine amidotransferase-related protein [Salinispira pacifica]